MAGPGEVGRKQISLIVGMVEPERDKDIWTCGNAIAMRSLKQRLLDYLLFIALLAMGVLVLLFQATDW